MQPFWGCRDAVASGVSLERYVSLILRAKLCKRNLPRTGDTRYPILFFFRFYAGVCKVASQKSLSKSKRCWDTRAHTKPTWECVGYCRLRKYSIKVRYSQSEKSNEKTAKRAVAIFYNGNNSGRSPAKFARRGAPLRALSISKKTVKRKQRSKQLYAAAQASTGCPEIVTLRKSFVT